MDESLGTSNQQATAPSLPVGEPRWLATPWILLAILLLVPLTRLPLHTRFLYHWDSVNFALALDHFDLSAHQPHPPGYILFVALAKLIHTYVAGHNLALILTANVFEAMAACFFFLLALEFVSRSVAVVTTGLFVFQPFFFFHGIVALSHPAEAAFSAGIAWCAIGILRGDPIRLWACPLLLAAAGGVRQHLMILLFPIYAYTMLRPPFSWTTRIASAVLLAGGILAWALPLFSLTGGFEAYRGLVAAQSRADLPLGSPLFGAGPMKALVNLGYLFLWLPSHAQLLWLVVIGTVFSSRGPTLGVHGPIPGGARWFLLAWIVPIALFQIVVFTTRSGQTMIEYPLSFLAVAWALERLRIAWSAQARSHIAGLAAGALIADGGFFFLSQPAHVDTTASVREWNAPAIHKALALTWNSFSAAEYSYAAAHEKDEAIRNRVAVIRRFSPEEVVVAPEFTPRDESGNWFRHLQYYLRGYTILDLRRDEGTGVLSTGAPGRDILFVIDDLDFRPDRPLRAEKIVEGVWRLPATSLPALYGRYEFTGGPKPKPKPPRKAIQHRQHLQESELPPY